MLENACREHVFLSEFFMVQGTATDDIFHQVMDKTLVLLQDNVQDYVNNSYDCIALFLCAHLTVRFREMCRSKGVASLERYFHSTLPISFFSRFIPIYFIGIGVKFLH